MRPFTPQEDQYIRDNCLTMSSHAIDKALGRSRGATRQRMARIGVVVPEEIRRKFYEESLIKPGSVPPNKGKRMPEHIREKVKRTWFPKGHEPHNTYNSDGIVVKRIDKTGRPYLYIRVTKGKWDLLHRYVWRKHHGEIPDGKLVVFKDGNSLNCEISNLELITLKDNMKRNSVINLPQEVRTAMAYVRGFNRKIKKYEQNH